MSTQKGFFTWCILLAVLSSIEGLKFIMSKSPGSPYCGRLKCWGSIAHPGTLTMRRLSIYDITKRTARSPIASINIRVPRLNIVRAKTLYFTGEGKMTKNRAYIFLNLKQEHDCLRGAFQCVLEILNAKSQVNTFHENITLGKTETSENGNGCRDPPCQFVPPSSKNDSCTCSHATESMANLTAHLKKFGSEILHLKNQSATINQEMTVLDHRRTRVEEELSDLKNTCSALQVEVKALDTDTKKETAILSEQQSAAITELTEIKSRTVETVKETNALLGNIQEEVNKLKQESTVWKQTREQEIHNAKLEIAALDTENKATVQEVRKLHENVTAASIESENITELFTTLRNNTAVLKKEFTEIINGMKTELDEQIAENLALKEEIQRQQQYISNIEAAADGQGEEFQKKLDSVIQDKASLRKELNELGLNDSDKHDQLYKLIINLNEDLTQMKQNNFMLTNSLKHISQARAQTYEELTDKIMSIEKEQNVLKLNNEEMNKEINSLRQNNNITKREVQDVEKKGAILQENLGNLQQMSITMDLKMGNLLNKTAETCSLPKVPCFKGMSATRPRQVFTLWGNVSVLCDTQTDGGGWIIIQRRTKGDVDFYRGWNDYKKGFGTPDTDFWIGNDIIHSLTSQGYNELRIDMKMDEKTYYASYFNFSVGNEQSKYVIRVGNYSGTAEDGLKEVHDGMMFTTYDSDNDLLDNRNCAKLHTGAWWYEKCQDSNLNGQRGLDSDKGMVWHGISDSKSLASSEMKVRLV